jgi:hypothetical protein
MKTIAFLAIVGDFAEDKDVAASLREKEIRPAIAAGENVILDFAGVTLATQSFVRALISDLLRTQGETVLHNIEFKNCVPGVKGIVETVVQYSLETMGEEAEKKTSLK